MTMSRPRHSRPFPGLMPLSSLYQRLFKRASIRLKLFTTMLALVVVLIVTMSTASHVIFKRDFLSYLNEQAQDRMEEMVPRLEQAYRSHQNWDFVRNDPRTWFSFMRPELAEQGSRSFNPPTETTDLTGATMRFTLLDAHRQFVIGYPNVGPEARLRPIMQDDAIVGWIAQAPFESVIGAVDVRFQQKQLQAQLLLGLVAVMLVGLIVIRIANVLIQPLVRIADATHELANGDYGIRVIAQSEDELGRLALDFNQLAHTLERNEKLRRDFMADISHELRTPLGILNGQIEALQDGVLQPDATTLASLKTEVRQLSKLVDDLYDLSLADAGALTYRKSPLDLVPLLEHTVQIYQERFSSRGIALHWRATAEEILVDADAARLQQLFNNLFENSLRYTDPHNLLGPGQLQVSVSADKAQRMWQIQLDDTAPEVEAAAREHLFERFFQVEASRNRASGGAGLGLAICQRIVTTHQGLISASDSPLGSLRITIALPMLLIAPAKATS